MDNQDRLKPRLLAPNTHISATSVNIGMIKKKKKKQHSLITNMEKVLVALVKGQTR